MKLPRWLTRPSAVMAAFGCGLLLGHYSPVLTGVRYLVNHDTYKNDVVFSQGIADPTYRNSIVSDSPLLAVPQYRLTLTNFLNLGGWFYDPRAYAGVAEDRTDALLNATYLPGALFPPNYWLGLRGFLLIALSVLGVYLLTGLFTRSRMIRWTCALMYVFCGPYQVYFLHYYRLTQFLGPYCMFFLLSYLRHRRPWMAAAYGLTLFFCIRNNEEYSFYLLLLLGVITAGHLADALARKAWARLPVYGVVLGATLLPVTVLIPHLTALTNAVAGGVRGRPPMPLDAAQWYLDVPKWAALLVSNLHGDGIAGGFNGPGNAVEYTRYYSDLTFLLLPFAVLRLAVRAGPVRSLRRGLVFGVLLAFMLALFILHSDARVGTLYRALPVIGGAAARSLPWRVKELFVLLAACVVAAGLSAFFAALRHARRRGWAVGYFSAASCLLVVLCVVLLTRNDPAFLPRSLAWMIAAVVAMAAFAGLTLHRAVSARGRRWLLLGLCATSVLITYSAFRKFHRNENPDSLVRDVEPARDLRRLQADGGGRAVVVSSIAGNALEMLGVRTLNGYHQLDLDQDLLTLFRAIPHLENTHNGMLIVHGYEPSPIYDLLNVQYVLGPQVIDAEDRGLRLVREYGDVALYQNDRARGAWAGARAVRVASLEAMVEHWKGANALNDIMVLDRDWPPEGLPEPLGKLALSGVREGWDRVSIEGSADAPSLVVASVHFSPDWSVEVDGRAVTPFRAFGNLLAFPVPAGRFLAAARFTAAGARGRALLGTVSLWSLMAVLWWTLRGRRTFVARAGRGFLLYVALVGLLPLVANRALPLGTADLRDFEPRAPRPSPPPLEVSVAPDPPPAGLPAQGFLDRVEVQSEGRLLRVHGWAPFDPASPGDALVLHTALPVRKARAVRSPRPDVARTLGRPEMDYAGFRIDAWLDQPASAQELSLCVTGSARAGAPFLVLPSPEGPSCAAHRP